MPISVRETDDGVGMLIMAVGEVTAEDYAGALVDSLARGDESANYRYALCDYSAVERVTVSGRDIEASTGSYERVAAVNPLPLVAIVATHASLPRQFDDPEATGAPAATGPAPKTFRESWP